MRKLQRITFIIYIHIHFDYIHVNHLLFSGFKSIFYKHFQIDVSHITYIDTYRFFCICTDVKIFISNILNLINPNNNSKMKTVLLRVSNNAYNHLRIINTLFNFTYESKKSSFSHEPRIVSAQETGATTLCVITLSLSLDFPLSCDLRKVLSPLLHSYQAPRLGAK